MKLKNFLVEKNWHRLFEVGITLKGLNGILETVSGCLVLLVSKNAFNTVFIHLTRNELLEDPHDRFIHFLAHALQHLSTNTKTFAALYILTHGILNIFLAIQLYRERLWAYLVTIGAIILFMVYQVYRISHTHSLALTVITIWDALFILITWHEYKYRKHITSGAFKSKLT